LSDILEKEVDQKYFLSEKATTKLLNSLSEEVKETECTTRGGVACTLSSEGGGQGAKTGLYVITKQDGQIKFRGDTATCLDANYYKGLDAHQAMTGVMEIRPVLTPDRAEKRQNGRRFKEDGEPMFTLTGQDRHGVAIIDKPVLVGGVGEINFGKQYRQGNRIYDADALAMCLHSQPVGNAGGNSYLYKTGMSIRKLTPRETFRLQGFPDWAFDRARVAGVSDSQLYKQAGNSVTTTVVYEIARRLE